MTGWQATDWWRVTTPEGDIRNEFDSEVEARAAVHPGDRLYRLFTLSEEKWVSQNESFRPERGAE